MNLKHFLPPTFLILSLLAKEGDEKELFNKKYLSPLHSMEVETQKMVDKTKESELKNRATQGILLEDLARQREKRDEWLKNQSRWHTLEELENQEAQQVQSNLETTSSQKKLQKYKDLILHETKIEDQTFMDIYRSQSNINSSPSKEKKERIFIVISSSIPINNLHELFEIFSGEENVFFILRGFIGGVSRFAPTKEFLEKVIQRDKERYFNVNIEINPKITRRYDIQKVPALIYTQNFNEILQEPSAIPSLENREEKYYIVYGMGGIEHALEKINKEVKSPWLMKLLNRPTFFRNGKP